MIKCLHAFLLPLAVASFIPSVGLCQTDSDFVRQMQVQAVESNLAAWGHWGADADTYKGWAEHSNRLIPVYTFGMAHDSIAGLTNPYHSREKLLELYGREPAMTLNPDADYFDQTGVYLLQTAAIAQGKKYLFLVVFDGMDWQTTQAAAIYKSGKVYHRGRGSGLAFQDYDKVPTDYGFVVTTPLDESAKVDVNAQVVSQRGEQRLGGYNAELGGRFPWQPGNPKYLISQDLNAPHGVTDSASSATSMTSGIKTFNGAINVDAEGKHVVPIARQLQRRGFKVGVVTSVPISHATPACAYANNVSRDDYQDLTRDMLGLRSISHRQEPLEGLDVLIGGGWGVTVDGRRANIREQGTNFEPGNKYLAHSDLIDIDSRLGGKYEFVHRTIGQNGLELLERAAGVAAQTGRRLFGFFGTGYGHLPYQTADQDFLPVRGVGAAEVYQPHDVYENPSLADMTRAALRVLGDSPTGFWLMVEAGDVDWANHDNNIDGSIGAVLSGEAAFQAITQWAEDHDCWDETAVIVTADHGHLLVLDQPNAFMGPSSQHTRRNNNTNSTGDKGK